MATVKAIYEDGVFKPTEPVHLAEHTEVEVSVPSPAVAPGVADDPTGWMAMRELGQTDLSSLLLTTNKWSWKRSRSRGRRRTTARRLVPRFPAPPTSSTTNRCRM
jgi:AF2212-like protein